MKLQNALDKTWTQAIGIWPLLAQFVKPTIKFNGRIYRTAGRCFVEENQIEISKKLFAQHEIQLLTETVPHEVAHQIDYNLNGMPKRWHNPNWQNIMMLLGQAPNPYHDMEYHA